MKHFTFGRLTGLRVRPWHTGMFGGPGATPADAEKIIAKFASAGETTKASVDHDREVFAADLLDPKSPQAIVDHAIATFGSLSSVVHIAGVGHVVFCASSSSAYRGSQGMVGYAATNHAVLGMMKTLTMELAPKGVRVNAISPGTTLSAINDSLFAFPGFLDYVLSTIPDGRIAEPHEHVGAVGYLLSDVAKHVYGQDIAIDGGRLAH